MNYKLLKRHPFNTVPNATETELNELRDSLKQGYDPRYPIYIFQGPDDEEPMVIDGMQRLSICQEESIEPFVLEFTGTNSDAINFILKSINRRNLSAGQKAIAVNELTKAMQDALTEEAEKRKKASQFGGGELKFPTGKTADKMAEQAGVSNMTWKRVKRLERDAPDLYSQVQQGNVSASSAEREIKIRQSSEHQLHLLQAKSIVKKAINEAAQEVAPSLIAKIVKKLENGENVNIKLKIIANDND